jgi:3-hydroxyisobutyrate dehydrogenase/glyoxylate/succinic semialdehyde reductase
MDIGFIGLGLMGSRMAGNLAKAGNNLFVFNRTKDKAEELLQRENVNWMESPKSAGKHANVLVTMLSDPDAVRTAALGDNGFLDELKKDAIWIDCSTVNPSFSIEMSIEAQKREVSFIDAPVAGSIGPAERGELLFLVGGDADIIKRCEPLFYAMGKKLIHAGNNGKGTSLKLIMNLLLGEAITAFSEGMMLGEQLGLDKKLLLDVLLESSVVPAFIKLKRNKIESGKFDPEFPLKLMLKDFNLVLKTAIENKVELEAFDSAASLFNEAVEMGYGEDDFSAIYQFIKENMKYD